MSFILFPSREVEPTLWGGGRWAESPEIKGRGDLGEQNFEW